jgi:hypothetical protein
VVKAQREQVGEVQATADGTEAGNPPGAEPYLRLARAGAAAWNQWQRTGMDAATAKRFKLDAVKPLSTEDAAALARRVGLDALPSHDRQPDFSHVDLSYTKNRGISFAGFVFCDGTSFAGAAFGDWTRFDGAAFGDGTRFDGWTEDRLRGLLEGVFKLHGAQGPDATAAGSRIEDRLKAARPGHLADVWFADAVFHGDTSFSRREFGGSVDFTHAVFRSVPDFAGCKEPGHLDSGNIQRAVTVGTSRYWFPPRFFGLAEGKTNWVPKAIAVRSSMS